MMTAESATLKLDNQKNGWKAACIHQEANREYVKCPVRTLARRVFHLRQHKAPPKTFLCVVFDEEEQEQYVCANDIRKALKVVSNP